MTTLEQSPSLAAPDLDDLARSSLQLIADSVSALAGFGVACISVARGDGQLEVVAVSASEGIRSQIEGTRTPITTLLEEVELADDWGLFRFLPAERLTEHGVEVTGWIPDLERGEGPDAWHPLDLLVAPLVDEDGRLFGSMSIDVPADGRRPGEEKRRVLERHAAQTARAIRSALERARLAREVTLAETTRQVIQEASGHHDAEAIVRASAPAMLDCFGADTLWCRLFTDGEEPRDITVRDDRPIPVDTDLDPQLEASARELWVRQDVAIVSHTQERNLQDRDVVDRGLAYLTRIGHASALLAPIGAGTTFLGALVLMRAEAGAEWTESEIVTVLQLSRDLGEALANARALARERDLIRRLQDLDRYRSELLRTVSHELKNPLTAILGNVELLTDDLAPQEVERALGSIERGADRMGRVIADLTAFSEAGESRQHGPVDLVAVVREVCDLTARPAAQRGVAVTVRTPDQPIVVRGDAGLLDRAVVNLVSNAVKYTPEGGHVVVTAGETAAGAELTVSDDGIGISAEDQARLFTEFFRSRDPLAQAQPGTGLGLAITARIVERHGGTIHVESTPGHGSTFRIGLPEA